jgi:hypothetical protein
MIPPVLERVESRRGLSFTQHPRREGAPAPAVGSGDLVSIEYWRVQVRLGESDSQLRTFDLRREPLAEQWVLETITDI